MKNSQRSVLSTLFSLGALFALGACVEPVIIGGNGNGGNGTGGNGNGGNSGACMADSNCAPGEVCVNGMCAPGGPLTCNGVPSPLSCTKTGCAMGQLCVPDDPNVCYPSACGCDAMTGNWVCTADCAQGSHCVGQMQCGPNAPCPPNAMCGADGLCHIACSGSPNMPEICNGIDDDCDGAVDEQSDPAFPICPDGTACVMGQCGGGGLICMSNADCPPNQVCQNGVCSGGATCTPEACNGLDDDCDGLIDEVEPGTVLCPNGAVCTNGQCGGNVQQCGPNSPPCPAGQICSPNGVCIPGGMCVPAPETCNGKDDDCDNLIDEVDPGTVICPNGGMCVNGQCGGIIQCGPNAPCPAGQVCTPNGVCSPGACMPVPETCNGKDDDCDGAIDDAPAGTTLCQGGTCIAGSCKIQCMANNNCPAGQTCVQGFCK